MKFHTDADQSRAILAKERREGWSLFSSLSLGQLLGQQLENHWGGTILEGGQGGSLWEDDI